MATVDPVNPLTVASGNLRRRKRMDRLMLGTSTAAAVFAVAILAIVIFSVVGKGASQLSISFLTRIPRSDSARSAAASLTRSSAAR